MAKKRFSGFRNYLVFGLIIAAALAYRQWIYEEEAILVDGNKTQIIDGDSFRIGTQEFRIYGVDAPEYRQSCKNAKGVSWACGRTSRRALEEILRKEEHNCIVRARDRFSRLIVKCRSEAGKDLGAKLVSEGFAISGQNFDETVYATDERRAQQSSRGIWQGEFVRPDVWRAQNPRI